ncbi:MAG: glycosyltransferase family 4 protein [Desulfobacterales bacterium]|nr:glycosyltransferase family 4 protein [Desulfobacterales bacterium]
MHILIISQYYWPENFRINELSLSLKDKGHKITVLTGKPNYPEGKFYEGYGFFKKKKEIYRGINIERVPIIPRGKGGGLRLILNYISFVISAGLIGPIKCRDKYDLIFVYEPSPITVGLPAILMKKFKAIPMMFWVQDLWPETLSAVGVIKSKKKLKFVSKIVQYIYSKSDKILIQSKSFKKSVVQYTSDHDKILYFPNSAEKLYKPIRNNNKLPEAKLIPPGFTVMFAGNIGVAQGFNTIIEAADNLKEYKKINWVILGDGRMRPWVENEIKKRGLEETFHLIGKHPIEKMPAFFSCSDVLLVTLKKDPVFSLTIPGKLQSYLACEKPLIASLDGAGADVVKESNSGIVCTPDDSNELSKAVIEMYNMTEEKRNEMGKKGRKYFEKYFDADMLVKKLENWMISLIEKK